MYRFPSNPDHNYPAAMVSGIDKALKQKTKRACVETVPVTKENAPAATEAGSETKLNRHYKRLPPYGKQLMAIREAGKVPIRTVMVGFDWGLAELYPRIIIPVHADPAALEFSFLAGLSVQINYHSEDAHRVDALVQAILRVNPRELATLELDYFDTAASPMAFIKLPQDAEVMGAA